MRPAPPASLAGPPEAIAADLASEASTHGRSALRRWLLAIGQAHVLAAHPWNPCHRPHHSAGHRPPARQPPPGRGLTSTELKKLATACGDDTAGLRDRALLLVGCAGALRRSELVGIDREHLRFTEAGLRILLPSSKTYQEGERVKLGLSRSTQRKTCLVRAFKAWLQAPRSSNYFQLRRQCSTECAVSFR